MHKFAKATIAIIIMSMCGDSLAAPTLRRTIGLMSFMTRTATPTANATPATEPANPTPEPAKPTPSVNNETTAV